MNHFDTKDLSKFLSNYDWKKAAAQVIDDNTVERAFMDQAYGFLVNKAGKLMRDPHRLGFEVVYKNDNNTRMVGIFAFRVNDQIVYVPVFFLNGEIKGTDLLYRQETKSFVPLNEEWVTFLTEKGSYEAGEGSDKKEFSRSRNHVRFEDIANPPAGKRASAAGDPEDLQTFADVDKVILNSHKKLLPAEGKLVEVGVSDKKAGELLHKFIVEDGGMEAVEKIATWMRDSFEFTEALVTNIDEKDYLPEDISVKSASAPATPKLVLFTGGFGETEHTQLFKSAADDESKNKFAEKFFSQGYYLWDDRAPSDITPIYKDRDERVEMIGSPGIYEVLMQDGTFRKAFVAPRSDKEFGDGGPECCSSIGGYYGNSPGGTPYSIPTSGSGMSNFQPYQTVVFMDGEKEWSARQGIHGKFLKDKVTAIKEGDLNEKPSSGKAYVIFDDESGTLSGPLYFLSVSDKDGVGLYETVGRYGTSQTKHFTHNPDIAESNYDTNFLGSHVYFIPVGVESYKKEKDSPYSDGREYHRFNPKDRLDVEIGTSSTLDSWIRGYVKSASILYEPDTDCFSWKNGPRDQSDFMPGVEMVAKLAYMGFAATDIDAVLNETKESGETRWYYGDPEMDMAKVAFPITLAREAIFRTTTDSDFFVNREYPQSFALPTAKDSRQDAPQMVGDAYDPGMGRKVDDGDGVSRDKLMTMSPEEIAQFASSKNLPNVFEHGLVGSLVQVYDSIAMIDKYLPDMEEGLDRLGRILFLFYWKPRDFEDAYGTDDMTNLENQLLSNFKSYGSLVLELLRKSKKRQAGNVSMS